MERHCRVYWGRTGTGKSRRAWEEAGMDAYIKNPNTKYWCGYSGQKNVIIDEFSGMVNITNMLLWLDRYPLIVEVKGSAVPSEFENIWITSNIDPENWYPEARPEQIQALLRRMDITYFE